MPTRTLHTELLNLLRTQQIRLDRFYAAKAREIAAVLKRYKLRDSRNVWKGNKGAEREVIRILASMDDQFRTFIETAMRQGLALNDRHVDGFVANYLKGAKLNEQTKIGVLTRSAFAAEPFVKERLKQLSLSPNVWNLAAQTKEQLESYLSAGLADGRSAQKMAGDLKQYLREPDRRYRRTRDPETGKLIISTPAKNYNPGRGRYRSSYKNALRFSRNEVNIAYRTGQYNRMQKLDFIRGIKINLSPAHPRYDICDELVGEYPKQVKFTGFHVQCLCYVTTILTTQEEFVRELNGGTRKNNDVKDIPKHAQRYLNEKSKQIKNLSSKPYFIADNFKNTKEGFTLKKSAKP